jgi:hypothetical protein
MEIFSEFEKIINGSLSLDMHYLASNAKTSRDALAPLVGSVQAL